MPLAKCPGCNCEQTVDAAFLGLRVRCKGCNAPFTAKAYRRPEQPTPWLVPPRQLGIAVAVTGGLAACVAVAVVLVARFHAGQDKPPVIANGQVIASNTLVAPGRASDGRQDGVKPPTLSARDNAPPSGTNRTPPINEEEEERGVTEPPPTKPDPLRTLPPVNPPVAPQPAAPPLKPPAANKQDDGAAPPKAANGAAEKRELQKLAEQLRKGVSPKSRVEAAEKLMLAGPKAADMSAQLCDDLLDPSTSVATAALRALEKVRPDLYPTLASLMLEGDGSFGYRRLHPIDQLSRLGADAVCCTGLLLTIAKRDVVTHSCLASTRGSLAFSALRSLCPVDANYLTLARQLAAQPGHSRQVGLNAIYAWAGDDEKRRKAVVPHVLTALKDDQCYLWAIKVATEYGPLARDAAPVLRQLKLSPSPDVRSAAGRALDSVEGR